MTYTPDQLAEEATKRRGESEERLAIYRKCENAYRGDENEGYVKSMDGQGRPLYQEIRRSLVRRNGAPNLLLPIVDDYVSLRGIVPTMKVMPEEDSEEARQAAVKRSRILRCQWDQSNMDIQTQYAAFHITCKGDVLFTLTPLIPDEATSLRPPGIYITVVDPATAFPRFRMGWDREELEDVIVWERVSAERVEAMWGVECSEKVVDVYHHIGRDYNCIDVDGVRVEEIKHDLGICPAQWARNKYNGRMAQSDISHAIDAHTELQTTYMVMNDSILEAVYAQLYIKNPVSFNPQFEVGPGAEPIVLQGDGEVGRVQPGAVPGPAGAMVGQAWEMIQRMTGSAPVRTEGQIPGSNISAKSVHAQQGPMETRLATSQTSLGFHYQKLNSKILHMLYTIPEFKNAEMSLWGQEKGTPYKLTFTGEELGGWTRNLVQWSAVIGSTAHERAVVGLQLKGQGLVPGEWVLEQIGVDDATMLIQEAKNEHQAAQGPPTGTNLPPDQHAAALEKGAIPGGDSPAGGAPAQPPQGAPQPPPSLPNFPTADQSPTKLGMGSPSPVPDVAGRISQILKGLGPRLAGDIVSGPTPIPGGIRIVVSRPSDRVPIRRAFREFGHVEVEVQQAA